jgi:hypothetical protein
MTNELAAEIEEYLNEKLRPEHGYILIFGLLTTGKTGIISNYSEDNVVKLIKEMANIACAIDPGENN